ncbi:MAG: hypothetical protein ACKVS9_02605, partial [Phycisphaerae bacterium]
PKAGCAMKHRQVTAKSPCPACGKDHWCAWLPDGALRCQSGGDSPSDMKFVRTMRDGAKLFAPIAASHRRPTRTAKPVPKQAQGPTEAQRPEFDAAQSRFADACTPKRRDELASQLVVTPDSLRAIGVGWATRDDLRKLGASGADWAGNYPDGAYSFPERDGDGRIVGFSLRTADGRKGSPSGKVGSRRGLVVPTTLAVGSGPVMIVEGASDVAACETLGIAAVGRPSNSGGAEMLARLLKGRAVMVVGENDQKDSGAWPGRDGAERIAQCMASEWAEPVSWTLPPSGSKDVRAWLGARVAGGLSLADREECLAAGRELLAELVNSARAESKARKLSQSDRLVSLALERYRLGLTDKGEAFAVRRDGPNIALTFRGSRDALRAGLASDYRRAYSRVATASALSDALNTLEGDAADCERETVHLRVGRDETDVILDLGDADGRAVRITPGGWTILDYSPILFRRTPLTGALAEPVRNGDLSRLREFLNVDDAGWPLLIGWLVSALIPEIPHPIVLFGGEQGTGKSSASRLLVALVDASPSPLRSVPRDSEAWAMAANGSWVVAIDNVSMIPHWWSDALCKAVTGDGWCRRALYTDSQLAVVCFRRCIILNSIDTGALRGDLGDRLLLVDLDRIEPTRRRREAEMQAEFDAARGAILGGLLDLTVRVLRELPNVEPERLPRMADFACILAACDQANGTDSLGLFMAQKGRIAEDLIDGDPVGTAVARFMGDRDDWDSTPSDLLRALAPFKPEAVDRHWPGSAAKLSGALKRLAPVLGAVGIETQHSRRSGGNRERRITLRKVVPAVPSVPSE